MHCWSYSSLKAIETCPRMGVLNRRRQADVSPASNPAAESGILCHEWARVFGAIIRDAKNEEDARAEALKWLRRISSRASTQSVADDVMEVCQGWLCRLSPLIQQEFGYQEHLFAVDEHFNMCSWDGPEARFRGVIDSIVFHSTTEATITDFKTGRRPDFNWLQLQIYAAILFVAYKRLERIRLIYHFVRLDWKPQIDVGRDDVSWVIPETNQRMQAADMLMTGDKLPQAKPSVACAGCTHLAGCPAWDTAIACTREEPGLLPPTSDAEATALKAWSKILKTTAGRMDDYIKEWVVAHGEIEAPDSPKKAISLRTSQKWEPDAKMVTKELIRRGIDKKELWAALNLTKKQAINLASMVGMTFEDIETLGASRPITSLRVVNRKPIKVNGTV